MRRAQWRRRADDPKGPLGWWWREIVERDRWLWLRLTVTLLFVAAALGGFSGHSLFTWLLLIAMFVSGGFAARRDPRRLQSSLPDPPPVDTFAVEVTIYQDRIVTGVDVAAASFLDGFLHIEGYHASFALRADDVRWVQRTLDEERVRFLLQDGQRVGFVPAARRKEFRAAVRAWSGAPGAGGVSTLPPMGVHPREFARAAAWFLFGFFSMGAWQFAMPLLRPITGSFLFRDVGDLLSLAVTLQAVRRLWILHRIEAATSMGGDDLSALAEPTQALRSPGFAQTSEGAKGRR